MNENDSEKLAGMLVEMGYKASDDKLDSDVIIFNTCCVRENAEQKLFGLIGALKKQKRENPNLIIGLCGCMMQQSEIVEQIKRKYRHIDVIFGTHNLYKFPEMLYNSLVDKRKVYDIWDIDGIIAEDIPIQRNDGIKAWVSIALGCNNFCSYCIVPYVRGRERSRREEDILKEIETLAKDGYKEITLLGQNVNSFGKDLQNSVSFAGLLYKIEKINGIERVRFMTSHPKDLSEELIKAIKECNKVVKHLHLPIQAGSTKVLEAMNRKYTKEQYLELVDKVKREIPEISITTDIIVGFPGETEVDFEHTLDVVNKVRYDMAYTFLYSKRNGTPAAKMQEQIPEEIKKMRFNKLLKLQNKISKEINTELVGKIVKVLTEGMSKNDKKVYSGRTDNNKIVNFKAENVIPGDLVEVKITQAQTWSLEGVKI
jgi:tRNA-2-methylthio-N6-dimethylallyladenosine synthase